MAPLNISGENKKVFWEFANKVQSRAIRRLSPTPFVLFLYNYGRWWHRGFATVVGISIAGVNLGYITNQINADECQYNKSIMASAPYACRIINILAGFAAVAIVWRFSRQKKITGNGDSSEANSGDNKQGLRARILMDIPIISTFLMVCAATSNDIVTWKIFSDPQSYTPRAGLGACCVFIIIFCIVHLILYTNREKRLISEDIREYVNIE